METRPLVVVVLFAVRAFAGVPVIVEELANQCRFDEALKLFDATSGGGARTRDDLALIRARLLLQLGRYDEALRATSGVAPSAAITLVRGIALAQLGQSEEAQLVLLKAQELGADELLVESARAILAMRLWDESAAEDVLVRTLKKDPSLTSALYNLACIRSSQGRLAESAGLIRQAWAVGWRNVPKLRSDTDLDALRRSGLIGDLLSSESPRCVTW